MEKTWWFEADGQRNGPVSESEIARLIDAREIDATTLIWTTGQKEWQMLETTELSDLLIEPPELPPSNTPPELPSSDPSPVKPETSTTKADIIELIKINKNSAKMVPASILCHVIAAIIGFIALVVIMVVIRSSTDFGAGIALWMGLGGMVITWAFASTYLEEMARSRIYDVELIFADGQIGRQSEGSKTTRALPWHEFFRRAMIRYADQHNLSAADTLIKAQAFYDMSGIKSRKIQIR
ncbi:MAG: GYF domain-containing protein [Pseudomonadota bacterium]